MKSIVVLRITLIWFPHCIQYNEQFRSLSIRQPCISQMSKLTYNSHLDRLLVGEYISNECYINFLQKIAHPAKLKPMKKGLLITDLSIVRSHISLMQSEAEDIVSIWKKLKITVNLK